MGIQLTDINREMVKQIAMLRKDGHSATPYLFGFLTARVDHFVKGVISRQDLADDAALIELLRVLHVKLSVEHLEEIAAGKRELPGEDVHSVQ